MRCSRPAPARAAADRRRGAAGDRRDRLSAGLRDATAAGPVDIPIEIPRQESWPPLVTPRAAAAPPPARTVGRRRDHQARARPAARRWRRSYAGLRTERAADEAANRLPPSDAPRAARRRAGRRPRRALAAGSASVQATPAAASDGARAKALLEAKATSERRGRTVSWSRSAPTRKQGRRANARESREVGLKTYTQVSRQRPATHARAHRAVRKPRRGRSARAQRQAPED